MLLTPNIHEIDDVRLTLGSDPWPVAEADLPRIAEHWRQVLAGNPRLWDGRVLGTVAPGRPGGIAIADRVLTATALEGDFSTFIAWRDWGFPETGIRNLFGSAVIRGADGALVYGVMGAHTANPGRVYPPGGSLEPRDVTADRRVDVLGSIRLELGEETGLAADEATVERILAVFDGPRVSIATVYRYDQPADALAARICDFLAAEARPELDGVAVVRDAADLREPETPPYALAIARHLLG